jgi:hypothetical protein
MKKIFAAIMMAAALFAGGYSGFMKLEPGTWAKYILHTAGGEMEMIHKYIGTFDYKGKKVNVIETELKMEGFKSITQYWSAVGKDEVMEKIITLTPHGLFCMEKEMIGRARIQNRPPYHTTTPPSYAPQKEKKTLTYTLKNDKKIEAAIFIEGDREVLVSSEVPFGIVAIKEKGKTVMELVDFGTGAKPLIPPKEALECTKFAPF